MSLYNPAEPLCRFYDDDGSPLSAGSLTIYIGEGDELAEVYDENGEAQANPVTLSARGECSIRLDDETRYHFVLRDAWGKVVWTSANYSKAIGQGDTITITAGEDTTITGVSSSELTITENSDGTWSFPTICEDASLSITASAGVVLDVSLGDITLTSTGYTAEGATEEVAYTSSYTIVGSTTAYSISVTSGDLDVTLSSVSVTNSSGSAFSIASGASVSLTLKGSNTLEADGTSAGLQVPEGAEVSICGSGSIAAYSFKSGTKQCYGAGIGGGRSGSGGTITIKEGSTVTAYCDPTLKTRNALAPPAPVLAPPTHSR